MDKSLRQGLGAVLNGEYETLGGFVLDLSGKVPVEGEQINLETGSTLVVEKADGRRVQKLTYIPAEKLPEAV
jgi:CBS domain containing-hemolysin-like protein